MIDTFDLSPMVVTLVRKSRRPMKLKVMKPALDRVRLTEPVSVSPAVAVAAPTVLRCASATACTLAPPLSILPKARASPRANSRVELGLGA